MADYKQILVDAKKLIDDADDAGDIMKNRNQELTEELQRKNQELEAKDDQLQRKTAECDGIKKEFDDFKGNLRRATEDGALQAFMRLIATVNTNLGGDPDNAVIPQQQLPNPVVTENRSGFSGYSHTGITTANNTPNYSTHGIPAPPPWPPSYEAPLYDSHGAPSSSTGRFPFTPPKRARTDGVQQDNYGGNSSNPNHLQPR